MYTDELNYLMSNVRYELSDGIHTHHQCTHCNDRKTRAGKCAVCLIREFIIKHEGDKNVRKPIQIQHSFHEKRKS